MIPTEGTRIRLDAQPPKINTSSNNNNNEENRKSAYRIEERVEFDDVYLPAIATERRHRKIDDERRELRSELRLDVAVEPIPNRLCQLRFLVHQPLKEHQMVVLHTTNMMIDDDR